MNSMKKYFCQHDFVIISVVQSLCDSGSNHQHLECVPGNYYQEQLVQTRKSWERVADLHKQNDRRLKFVKN